MNMEIERRVSQKRNPPFETEVPGGEALSLRKKTVGFLKHAFQGQVTRADFLCLLDNLAAERIRSYI